jgi:uncharacterized protein
VTATGAALRSVQSGVRIDIRVVPRASRNAIDGVRDSRLIVRVTAPPVDEAANDAVVALLADVLDVPRRSVRIVVGDTARNKTIEIAGVDERALRARLAGL